MAGKGHKGMVRMTLPFGSSCSNFVAMMDFGAWSFSTQVSSAEMMSFAALSKGVRTRTGAAMGHPGYHEEARVLLQLRVATMQLGEAAVVLNGAKWRDVSVAIAVIENQLAVLAKELGALRRHIAVASRNATLNERQGLVGNNGME